MVIEDQYERLLKRKARERKKFVGIKGEISNQNPLQMSFDDLFICYKIKHLFIVKPSFEKNIDADESYR